MGFEGEGWGWCGGMCEFVLGGRGVKLIYHLANLESIYIKSFKKVFKFKTTVTFPFKIIEKFLPDFLRDFYHTK